MLCTTNVANAEEGESASENCVVDRARSVELGGESKKGDNNRKTNSNNGEIARKIKLWQFRAKAKRKSTNYQCVRVCFPFPFVVGGWCFIELIECIWKTHGSIFSNTRTHKHISVEPIVIAWSQSDKNSMWPRMPFFYHSLAVAFLLPSTKFQFHKL